MTNFDSRAQGWDKNVVLHELAETVGAIIRKTIPQEVTLTGLEIGSGTGLLGLTIAKLFQKITFVDASAEMLVFLRDKICRAKINDKTTILKIDLDHEKLPGTYDCIFSQMMLHHVHNTEKLFAALKDNLNPNGYLFFADLYIEDGSFHGETIVPHNGFDPATIKKILTRLGFSVTIHENIFTIEKESGIFPIFLIAAQKI